MTTPFYFIRIAFNNIRRGGQRELAALLCIVFGVMALVAMSMLAESIQSAVDLQPNQVVGGDISMGRKTENTLSTADIDQLTALQKGGEISRYTLIAFNSSIMFHTPGSGEMHFVGSSLGVQPDNYPLAGSLTIGEPGSVGLPTLLQQVGDVVVTRDIAESNHLAVGDTIILADLGIGVPVKGTIRGIAYDTPNHQGDKIYYSLATAQALENSSSVVNTVIVNSAQPSALASTLNNTGWSVEFNAENGNMSTVNLWMMGLRGAGILGLLVSGIGIANTMQVLLRRRQREIAIWKILGYREDHLYMIFMFEAGLLGLLGSLLGAGIGVLISTGLLKLFRNTSTLLYQWIFSPVPPLVGVLVGTLTTVIFATWAIVASSQAKPMALLRNEPMAVQKLPFPKVALLISILAGLFIALISLIMGSLFKSVEILVGILVGLGLLGGVFSFLLWLFTRIFRFKHFPLARMAVRDLRRHGAALVFAMIALFIGVFSMSMGMLVAQIGQGEISSGSVEVQGNNINILTTVSQEAAVQKAVQAQNPLKVAEGYTTMLSGLSVVGNSASLTDTEAVLVGRSDAQDYDLSGADWGSQPDGVYVPKWEEIKTGSQVVAKFADGTSHTFTVVGFYEVSSQSTNLYPPTGLLLSTQAFSKVVKPDSVTFYVQVESSHLDQTVTVLSAALPQATVINLVAYATRFMLSYRNLLILALALASLALLAGLLLVANSVSLAMLDQRYEIGILKSVGYSRQQIISIFAVEYGLVGLLATGVGVLLIQGMLELIAIGNHLPASLLMLNLPSLLVVFFCGVGLTLLTVLGVIWRPTQVSPVLVLNEQN